MWYRGSLATISIALVALLGDYAVTLNILSENVKSIIDNLTHGFIGVCTWLTIITRVPSIHVTSRLWEIGLCGFFASAIDLDHFAAAKSLRLQDFKDLELFSVIVGAVSLGAIFIIICSLFCLNNRISKLKRELARVRQVEQQHSFYNPSIHPEEELGKRGFSMYSGQAPLRPGNLENNEPQYERPAYPGNNEPQLGRPAYPGNNEPQLGRPAYPGNNEPQYGRPAYPGNNEPQYGRPAYPGNNGPQHGRQAYPGNNEPHFGSFE